MYCKAILEMAQFLSYIWLIRQWLFPLSDPTLLVDWWHGTFFYLWTILCVGRS